MDFSLPQIEAWITRRTASIAAVQPGSEFSSLADSESSAQQNIGTEGSIVGDLEVHESIEVNAKMADLTRVPLAHQVTPMAHLETIEMSRNPVPTQLQAQAQSFVDLTEPQEETAHSWGKLEVSLADQLV